MESVMKIRTARFIPPVTPIRLVADVDDAFDDLVERACNGDRRALGAIAIALSSPLLAAIRIELGDFGDSAGDVLHDFFAAVMAGGARFGRGEERARDWLMRIVREMARRERAARERDWGAES
jgi:hypothetical protein